MRGTIMTIQIELINDHSQINYQAFMHRRSPLPSQHPNLITLGVIDQEEPVGVITIEVKSENGILINYNVKEVIRLEAAVGNEIMEQVEKLLSERGINYIFYFHSDKDPLTQIIEARNWKMNISQIEYVFNANEMVKHSSIPKLPKEFSLVRFNSLDKKTLSHLIISINEQLSRDIDHLPPIDLISPSTSAFLIRDQKIVGWFLSSLQIKQNNTALSIERFWTKPEFREYKVSVRFVKHMMRLLYQENNYQHLLFNLMYENKNLAKVVGRRGLFGELQSEEVIYRSYKKL